VGRDRPFEQHQAGLTGEEPAVAALAKGTSWNRQMHTTKIRQMKQPSPDRAQAEHAAGDGNASAVQRVIDLVLQRIRSGEYVPGQMIIAQDLMSELSISKAPVREGIHVLVGEGVMELLPNRSARIRKLSNKDLRDFTEVWGVIGGLNMRLAAEHVGDKGNRQHIVLALQRIQKTGKNRVPFEFFMAVANFHQTLAAISGNSYIRTIISRAHFAHFHRHIERTFPGPYWNQHLHVFQRVGEALLKGEGEQAERLFRRHIDWALGKIM
jgi:DNA-binding GntR family transcriptional regulator